MKQSETRPRGGLAWFKGSTSTSEQRRPLLDAGEVRQLAYDEQLVLVTGEKPFRTRKVQWFRHRLLRRLGTNLRRGGEAPGQNAEILKMASRQPEHPAAAIPPPASRNTLTSEPAVVAAAAGAMAQRSASPHLANLARRIGWNEAARLIFPAANVSTARGWINGYRAMPPEHERFVARLTAWVGTFEGTPAELQAQLTPERIEDFRREPADQGEVL